MSDDTTQLTPEQIALLAPFVREYEQAQAELAEATQARDRAAQRMLRAGALALGGRTDLAINFDTYAVVSKENHTS